MNMPLVSMNRRRRIGGAATPVFSPSALFALAEPGVWYDPSDVANLAWRRNLLTFTEQFDNAAWSRAGVLAFGSGSTANAVTSPDGATTADLITEDTATGQHILFNTTNLSLAANTQHSFSCYIKAGTRTAVALQINGSVTGGASVVFSLSTEFVTQSDASSGYTIHSSSITPAPTGGGWYRCSLVFSSTGTVLSTCVCLSNSDTPSLTVNKRPTYTGNGTSGLYIWGAQLETGTLTDYQRISDVNTEVIERFPSATLYQDTAGTTPVTTPGQTVALALDKSKGLVLGSELVTNGTFATDTNWTKGVGWTISGGVATRASDASVSFLSQANVFPRTGFYRLSITVTGGNGNAINIKDGGFLTLASTSTNLTIVDALVFATAGSLNIEARQNATCTVDNISVKELPGFHATQATLASRPTYGIVPLGGRRNLLTRTEEFNDAAWTKNAATVSANTTLAPNGSMTADTLTATGNFPFVYQDAAATATAVVTFRHSIRKTVGLANGSFPTVSVEFRSATTSLAEYGAVINTNTGQIAAASGWGTTGFSATSIVSDGDYWTVVATTSTAPATTTVARAYIGVSGGFADGTRRTISFPLTAIIIWGAQLETGSSATAYQRVGSAFDVTEAGVASLSYLSFDGVDDFLVTPTITPGIDKVTVGAGVRKLSDAASGVVIETSAIVNTNNGALLLAAPSAAGANSYAFFSKGTTSVVSAGSGVFAAAPNTSVLTGIGDISGDVVTLRRNGSLVQTTTTDQGTGNYLAYPAYIGRRFDTSGGAVAFNGQLYSLVVRFAATDLTTIGQLESWINGKTGAYS